MHKEIFTIEGNIVNIDGQKRARVEIDQTSGLITKVVAPTGVADLILKDELIFPGFVDLHVHAREDVSHKQDYKEDFSSASDAAINGGVVAFIEMPNNPVPPVDDESYKNKKELTKNSKIEIILYGGIGENTKPLSIKVPYKVYMGPSVGTLFFKSLEELENVLSGYKGCSVSFHCEDPKILEENKDKPTHVERRPKIAELSAIDFALLMIEKYNLLGKICHASTREGIDKIKNAKSRKLNVVAEVSPHHLFFSAEGGSTFGGDGSTITDKNEIKMMQMNPPLRSREDREYLIEALRGGAIDFIATDHAPHTIEEKLQGTSGTPQLDTYGLFVSWLMEKHGFTPEQIARVCSYNPGKFINEFTTSRYGKIEEGYTGSLSVIDTKKPTKVTKDILKTKCHWSTFEGFTFPGSVVMTVIKGTPHQNKLGTGQEIYAK